MGPEDDWFDSIASADTPLFIDPFLVFSDPDPFWAGSGELLSGFFGNVLDLIDESRGNIRSSAWTTALGLLLFPEPNEFSLGLPIGSPRGSGIGRGTALTIAQGLRLTRGHIDQGGFTRPEVLSLLCEGVGPDRIIDMFCNKGQELRASLNEYLRTQMSQRERPTTGQRAQAAREFARARPDLALAYVESTDRRRRAYDLTIDPQRRVTWLESG